MAWEQALSCHPDRAYVQLIIDLSYPPGESVNDGIDPETTCLTFLGIEVDTVAAQLRLPADKLQRLVASLTEWGDRKACTRRELESPQSRV